MSENLSLEKQTLK